MKNCFELFMPFKLLKDNVDLFQQMLHREVELKYKGSYLGILWNFLTPTLMLIIYTFVFGVVFHSKWEKQLTDSQAEFALTLFAGIIMYTFFSDALNRSPLLICNNVNYVKKVIFPLEILSMANISSLLVQMGFNIIIIVVGKAVLLKMFDFYFLLFPIIMIPLFFFSLGLSWLFSALGVFVRDIQQTVSIVVLVLGYMTPVFYPASLVPEQLQWIMKINPLTFMVSSGRELLMYKHLPDGSAFLVSLLVSYIVMMVGFEFFRRVKADFSDVL